MAVPLLIYLDRLGDGHVEEICEEIPLEWLSNQPKDAQFVKPVKVTGKAYLADNHLILDLFAKGQVIVPCSVCGERCKAAIVFEEDSVAVDISAVKDRVYSVLELVMPLLVSEIPQGIECQVGGCPNRPEVEELMKKSQRRKDYHPFADL